MGLAPDIGDLAAFTVAAGVSKIVVVSLVALLLTSFLHKWIEAAGLP
jgi:hypothetical protein